MQNNVLSAITYLVNTSAVHINSFSTGTNRINNVGIGLESFIKDIFAETLDAEASDKKTIYKRVFSYLGNSSNPLT